MIDGDMQHPNALPPSFFDFTDLAIAAAHDAEVKEKEHAEAIRRAHTFLKDIAGFQADPAIMDETPYTPVQNAARVLFNDIVRTIIIGAGVDEDDEKNLKVAIFDLGADTDARSPAIAGNLALLLIRVQSLLKEQTEKKRAITKAEFDSELRRIGIQVAQEHDRGDE